MKLSPPASSSDIDAAREIARRLHQRRRREDRSVTDERDTVPQFVATPEAPLPAPPVTPAPPPVRPAATPVRPAPPPVRPAPPPLPRERVTPEPVEPPLDEPGGPDAPALDALDALPGIAEAVRPAEPPPARPGAMLDVDVDIDVEEPRFDVEEPPVSPEEMVGAGEPPPLDDLPESGPPLDSPFDVDLDEPPVEDMVEIPTGPSWDDIAVACLGLAKARGAMLVDPAGQVFAARGDWPEPGPDAIAAKLVSKLNTLKDAPTRSISAPLLGKHLTAWRVSLADGLVTAAFIGDAPVGADARPAIDAEISRGPGA
jgi:hypothetical protein